MKKYGALLWAVLLCLLFAACGRGSREPPENDAPPAEEIQPPAEDAQGGLSQDEEERRLAVGHLTVELVADWEQSDQLLSEVDELSRLLRDGLRESRCDVENVTITLSTAGGITGNALAEGGVDLACMPAVDYIACEEAAYAVLTTDEELCTAVLAVSKAREELDEAFCAALSAALLETESGAEFLELYSPGLNFLPADDGAIEAVREWLAVQEEEPHGA